MLRVHLQSFDESEFPVRSSCEAINAIEANFIPPMYHRCSSRAQLVEPTRGTRMLPYTETLMPKLGTFSGEEVCQIAMNRAKCIDCRRIFATNGSFRRSD